MNANEYQRQAGRTLISAPDFQITDEQVMIVWCAVGMTGEAGEVMEHIKKGIFHQHGLNREQLRKELGDVLWYVAGLCSTLGFDLSDVMSANIEKLKARYPDGWDHQQSIHRTSGDE